MAETTEPTTMDPATTSLSPQELQTKLSHLKASATQQYSLKNYSAAAEFYSEAAEVQDLINGEMSPENADLLYQYGRCLYHVGVSKSDVLGGKVAGTGGNEEPKRKKRKTAPVAESSAAGAARGEGAVSDALKDGEQKLAEEVVGAAVEEKEGGKKAEQKVGVDKPFFQITGDENWTDSEDEEDEDGEDGENGEEEDDDFAIAYEILDVARVLLARKLASLPDESAPEARQLKERLADTHDLQAEIKLENEQFGDAVADAKETLKYKLELFPQESGMIAEAHYKLAIALDFASLPTAPAGDEENGSEEKQKEKKEEPKVNEEMRSEAASEMEKAIASCQLRIQKDEASLSSSSSVEATKRTIADVKSMVAEMKNRLVDLRNPAPAALSAGDPMGALDGSDPLRGVLGAVLGESKAEQQERLREVTSQANDLSGLVKKRKAKVADEDVEGKGKKAKVEEK